MNARYPEGPARLALHPTAFIAPGAVVVGEVTLGARASVWFNTVVRGDSAPIAIGDDSNVQDNSVVHVDEGQPAVIGARVTVGHRSIIHGCVIEDDCLVGMGSVVLSGARIGSRSFVGAAALVLEGQRIPPESLVLGAPAKVVGPVNAAHRDAADRGASHYAALARGYLRRGFAEPHPFPDGSNGGTRRGPMSFLEWAQRVAVLSESPEWVAERLQVHGPDRWRTAPGANRWSALEVLCHLRDADHEVLLPRLIRLLDEEVPEFDDVDMRGWDMARGYRDQSPHQVLAEWSADRSRSVSLLQPLGRSDWDRLAFHSVRGPYPLAEMVRSWADHDLSHRRQITVALGDRS